MKIDDIRKSAFAMPLASPSYPRGPYRFYDREYFVITYRTDMDALRAVVPEPLEVDDPIVKYEFIRMPDSTGFGDYTETGQVVPVRYKGEAGNYTLAMFLDDEAPISGGREIWGFPKKRAMPKIMHEGDVVTCTLHYGSALVGLGTMGYKHRILDTAPIQKSMMETPNFLVKIIPHVDGTTRVCELVRFYLEDVQVKGAWASPAALQLFQHAIADIACLPVREIVSAVQYKADLTLGLGKVEFDYLAR